MILQQSSLPINPKSRKLIKYRDLYRTAFPYLLWKLFLQKHSILTVKKLFNQILPIIVIAITTAALFEAVIALSFDYPQVWTHSPNKFFHQKLYRSQRNIIQFMPECAEHDRLLGYRNKTGECIFSNEEFETTVLIGEAGRLVKGKATKPVTLCSAVFLGDSHTFGWGVEQKETFSHLIASGLGCEARNYGVSSYGTARQAIDYNLRSSSTTREPNYIFVQYSDNDFKENITFLNNEGSLPTMSKETYEAAKLDYLNRQKYFPFKYGYIVLRRVTERFFDRLTPVGQCAFCSEKKNLPKMTQA